MTKVNASAGGMDGAKLSSGSVTNTQIVNRTRRFMIGSGAFLPQGTGAGVGNANFGASSERYRAAGISLGNNANNVATATFVVPSDYVAGAPPKFTVWWATDEGGASRQVDVDVSFMTLSSLTASTTNVAFQYNFRNSSGSATTASDSLNPTQSAIAQQVIPEGTETWSGSPTWNPGDVIILSIGRNGSSASDPNSGNMYLYGVSFDYTADM